MGIAASIAIQSLQCGVMSLEQSSEHPNAMKFTGVLTRVDEASDKAPHGANGHKIRIPKEVAQRRIKTLIGMGLNYRDDMADHAPRRKVGVITKAWLGGADGKDVVVKGLIWKHDFPEAKRDLKRPGLGMSMELSDVQVDDQDAAIWDLKDLCFIGGTILWKRAAAYHQTHAIAAKADTHRGDNMPATAKKKAAGDEATNRLITLVASAVGAQLAPQFERFESRMDGMEAMLVQAADGGGTEDDGTVDAGDEEVNQALKLASSACGDTMKAKKKDDDDDDDDDEEEEIDATIDKGDLTDMGSLLDSQKGGDEDEDDPGHLNKGATNKGRKQTVTDKVGKTVSSSAVAQLTKNNKTLAAAVIKLSASVDELSKRLSKYEKQVKVAAAATTRKSIEASGIGGSIPSEVTMLMGKAGLSPADMRASGQVLTVSEVDAMLQGVQGLDIVGRMTIKNKMLQAGLMEQGGVTRQ